MKARALADWAETDPIPCDRWIARKLRFSPLLGGPAFSVVMYGTGRFDRRGSEVMGYRFRCIRAGEGFEAGQVIFEGEDYSPGPRMTSDGDACFGGLLGFHTHDYGQELTEPQRAFVESFGDHLACEAEELESA